MDVRSLDPDTRAYALVGMFLQYWALMEANLRDAIGKALGLNALQAAIVTSNIQLRDKISILKAVVASTPFPDPPEQEHFTNVLQEIADGSSKRNMVAHDLFYTPDDGDGVQFMVIRAKGKLTTPETIWSIARFEQEFKTIQRWATQLDRLSDRIVFSDKLLKLFAGAISAPSPGPFGPGLLSGLDPPPPENRTSETSLATPEKEGGSPPDPGG